jgi:hypothetical protein
MIYQGRTLGVNVIPKNSRTNKNISESSCLDTANAITRPQNMFQSETRSAIDIRRALTASGRLWVVINRNPLQVCNAAIKLHLNQTEQNRTKSAFRWFTTAGPNN